MDKNYGIQILAESIVKIETVKEEADNNLDKTICYFTELSDVDTLKNTIKEEYYEDELERPATVFIKLEAQEEEIGQEYEDPLSFCGDNLSNAFLENEESFRSPNTGGGSPTTVTLRGIQIPEEHADEQSNCDCTRQFCEGEVAASTLTNPCVMSLCAIRATDITSILALQSNMNVELPFACNICPKKLPTRKSAIAHIQYHTLNDPCKCTKCTSAPTDEDVVEHEQIHTGVGTYECNKCKRHFLLRTNLVQHMPICTGLHYCPVCKKKCSSRAGLAGHIASYRKENLHSCTVCQKSFFKRKELISHLRITHSFSGHCSICKVAIRDTETLEKHKWMHFGSKCSTCSICQENFRGKSRLAKHMLFHSERAEHTCSVSQKGGKKRRRNLLSHRRTHTRNRNIPAGKRQHCSICQQSCKTKGHLRQHMRIHDEAANEVEVARNMTSHTDENLYGCTVCQENFCESKELILHMQIHTHCSICEMKFKDHGTLMCHMLTHSGEELYECPICKKSFTARESFVTHMPVHVVEKPFECGICKESFSARKDLLTHLLVHVGKSKKECAVCQRSFVANNNWYTHMQIHIREKIYECSLCQKGFPCRRTLFEHVWEHVGEKKWACSICQKKFKHTTGLVKHVLTHSEDERINALRENSEAEKLVV